MSEYLVKKVLDKTFFRKPSSSLLGSLDMELTERCNNNCIHCYINRPANDVAAHDRELSTFEIQKILEEAAGLGCPRVRFTGGEPLLRPDFADIYIFARKLGLKVMLFTNATLITEAMADLFCRIPPLEKIEVSVYGMMPETYEAVTRIPGSFQAFERGVRLLQEKNIPFIVKGVLLPSSQQDIAALDAWAATIPWMDRPPSHNFFFTLCARGNCSKSDVIKRIRIEPEEGVAALMHRSKKFFKDSKEFCSKFMKPYGDRLIVCAAGMGSGCVDAYGIFQPCMILRHPEVSYDLKNGSLKDALENFFPAVRERRVTNKDFLKRCAVCFLGGLCEQCPGKSWTEHGTLDTPVDYYCDIAHAQARSLGLIQEGERAWEAKDGPARVQRFLNNPNE